MIPIELNIIFNNFIYAFLFRNEILSSLNSLCQEHLAFSSKLVFDFFDTVINYSPDIISSFVPKLIENIVRVEWKRGIGSDFTLRYYFFLEINEMYIQFVTINSCI